MRSLTRVARGLAVSHQSTHWQVLETPNLLSTAAAMATVHRLLLAATAALLFLLPRVSIAAAVEYCKKGREYPVKVTGVEVIPDPVVRGEPATFRISASTDKSIADGKLVIDVTYFFFHVHSETHNFCDGTSCPALGEFVLVSEQTLPSFTPPGSYTITVKLLGDRNEELTCISFGFSIGFATPLAIS